MNLYRAMRSEDTEQIAVISWANLHLNRHPELKYMAGENCVFWRFVQE